MGDHKRIWLQHPDDADLSTGRLWCQDKVWPDQSGGKEPTEYVRADLVAGLYGALEDIADLLERVGDSRKDAWAIDAARSALTRATGG